MYEVNIYLIAYVQQVTKCHLSIEIAIPMIGTINTKINEHALPTYSAYATALKIADAFPNKEHVNIYMGDNVSDFLFKNEKEVVTTNNNHLIKNTSIAQEVK